MARPQRNNVDYFPHPVKHGKKMSYIEKKYKNDGYAVWMKLLEELGDNNYHYLDLSDEVQIMFLEEKCNVSQELLMLIINDLVKLGEFNRTLWDENSILFNEKFTETIKDAYNKRNNKCMSLDGLFALLEGLGVRKPHKSNNKGDENPQTKEEDSKKEETILELTLKKFKEIKKETLEAFSFIEQLQRESKLSENKVIEFINKCFDEFEVCDDIYRTRKDYRTHILNKIKNIKNNDTQETLNESFTNKPRSKYALDLGK